MTSIKGKKSENRKTWNSPVDEMERRTNVALIVDENAAQVVVDAQCTISVTEDAQVQVLVS